MSKYTIKRSKHISSDSNSFFFFFVGEENFKFYYFFFLPHLLKIKACIDLLTICIKLTFFFFLFVLFLKIFYFFICDISTEKILRHIYKILCKSEKKKIINGKTDRRTRTRQGSSQFGLTATVECRYCEIKYNMI